MAQHIFDKQLLCALPLLCPLTVPSLDQRSLNALKTRPGLNGALWWRWTAPDTMVSPAWISLCVTSALLASRTLASLGSHSRRIYAIYPSIPQASQQPKPRPGTIQTAEDAQITRNRQRTSTVTHGKITQHFFPHTQRHTDRIIEMPLLKHLSLSYFT